MILSSKTSFLFAHFSMPYTPLSQKENQKPKAKKQWWKLGVWIAIIAILVWWWSNGRYNSMLSKTISNVESYQSFVVESGNSPQDVAQKLEETGLIVSSSAFVRYIKEAEKDTSLFAEVYSLSPHLTIPQIANILTSPTEYVSITIPEGLTLEQMDDRFAEKGYFEDEAFLTCIKIQCDFSAFSFLPANREHYEGYFFPATYSIKKQDLNPETLAKEMLKAFEKRISTLGLKSDSSRSLHDIVVMASIIERETSSHTGEESRMISGILWNRIDQNIPIGADATTRYALSKERAPLTKTDLSHSGPFNTRLNTGLPPHAIAAPGDSSLLAAKNPANTSYLFYLHDQNKQIHYAVTNAQHESNKATFCGGSCE